VALVSRLKNSKLAAPLVVGLVALVALAVVGTTIGYNALSTTVTVSVDGKEREVTGFGSKVGDILEAEGIELGQHDEVAPGVDETVDEGSRITVRHARKLDLVIDGKEQSHWVTATDVASALQEIGRTYDDADLSVSRSAGIGREGMALEVTTPKRLTVALAGKKPQKRELTVTTVREALAELGVKVGSEDKVTPGLGRRVTDGDRIVFTDFETTRKTVNDEEVDFETVEREDDSMYEGEEEVEREGRVGLRDVVYRLVLRNGEVVEQAVLRSTVTRKPVSEIVRVGTKPEPEEEPAADYSGGNTVWDRLAECESGGNWAANTGNGYYGGLQFSASTWHAVGGSGLPHENSREEQIKRGQILQSQSGWGQWPACAAELGLI